MVLAAVAPRRVSSEAPAGGLLADRATQVQATPLSSKEQAFGFANEIIIEAHLPPHLRASFSQQQRPLTPREQREQRRHSIRSCMEVIESSMTSEDWTHLKRLAKQGAVHYQAEEDFMCAPVMRRSQSAPNSSLAERYERLRSCTSPDHFRRPATADNLLSPMSVIPSASDLAPARGAAAAVAADLSPLSGTSQVTSPSMLSPTINPNGNSSVLLDSSCAGAATVPRRTTRAPTRILVRSADAPTLLASSPIPGVHYPAHNGAGAMSECDSARAPSPPPQQHPRHHSTDAHLTDDSRASMDSHAVVPARAKRGSDPHVDAGEEDKTPKKKKNRGLFHRRRRYTESASESTEESTSPMRDRSWTQRVQHYMQALLRRR
eukprot:m.226614 g.226614  ORF g.226614 m.226614 type:complete len:377 (+) comp16993_c0_seq1:448-1578(+)